MLDKIDFVPGEVLYFYPEELAVMILMANEEGVRYYEPMNPEFDDNGNLLTSYLSKEAFSEWTISLGTVNNISAILTNENRNRKSY